MTTETAPNRVHDLETLELKLQQTRDELRLKMHLARADARDRWEEIEKKWHHFGARAEQLRKATDEAGEGVWKGLKALGHEIADGYDSVRRMI